MKVQLKTGVLYITLNNDPTEVSVPALRPEVLHGGVSLVGGQDGDLLSVRPFSGGDDFVL